MESTTQQLVVWRWLYKRGVSQHWTVIRGSKRLTCVDGTPVCLRHTIYLNEWCDVDAVYAWGCGTITIALYIYSTYTCINNEHRNDCICICNCSMFLYTSLLKKHFRFLQNCRYIRPWRKYDTTWSERWQNETFILLSSKWGLQVLSHKSLKMKLIIFHRLISTRSLISAFSMGLLSLVPPPFCSPSIFCGEKIGGRGSVVLETTKAFVPPPRPPSSM